MRYETDYPGVTIDYDLLDKIQIKKEALAFFKREILGGYDD